MNYKDFDEKNNSIATVLVRKKFNDQPLYEFTYKKSVIGSYDNKTKIFTDVDGKKYYSMDDPRAYKNYNNVFGTFLEEEDLDLVFSIDSSDSRKVILDRYDDYVKKLFYIVKLVKNNDGKTVSLIKELNLDKIEESFDSYGDISDLFDYSLDIVDDYSRSEKFLAEDFDENTPIINDLAKLIMDVYNCNYNSDELFLLADHINYLSKYFDCALDTIDLQLHAYHNGEKEPLHISKADIDFINSDYDPYNFSEWLERDDEQSELFLEKEKTDEKQQRKMDLIKLRDEIKKYLINQDDALRRVLVEIARMDIKENENNKGILLLGDSGTGKTYLMELLAEKLGVPFLIVDSTQLTIPGYVGKDIQEYLWDLYEKCGKDIEKCEQAIVFFDEIDKKGSNRKSDSSGQGVLNVLLKFLDGTVYDAARDTKHSNEIVKIDTSKMKIIAGGAFADVFKSEQKKNIVGFRTDEMEDEYNKKIDEQSKSIPDVDTFVQKAFMTPEFMGRFPIRIRLNPHTIESFSTILKESNSSTLKEEENTFAKLGVKLSVTPEFINLASSEALKLKTGVRGLMGTIEESTWVAFEDVYNNPGMYEEIILTEETLKDPANYQKVLKMSK